jgi:predicted amidohydrolase YtcJ
VRLYTARSVELAPFEDALDQVAEGFEASFVVLDHDIFAIDVEEIDQTVVDQTWIRGEKVYERR